MGLPQIYPNCERRTGLMVFTPNFPRRKSNTVEVFRLAISERVSISKNMGTMVALDLANLAPNISRHPSMARRNILADSHLETPRKLRMFFGFHLNGSTAQKNLSDILGLQGG